MYKKLLRKINNLSELVMKFSDKELKNKTDELKKRISNNEKEIDILPRHLQWFAKQIEGCWVYILQMNKF